MGVECDIFVHIPEEGKHITGERISGIVKLHLDKDKVYKKITLSLIEKKLSWHDYGRKDIDAYTTHKIWTGNRYQYEDDEIKTVVEIDLQTNKNQKLKQGSHEYPFEMKIPENIPPSVCIKYYDKSVEGIEYYLLLKLIKPLFTWDTYFKTRIKIHNRIDSSITEEPIIVTLDKTLLKPFSKEKQEIKLKAVLDKGYFIPLSERRITFAVINNTDLIFTVQTEFICKTQIDLDIPNKKTEVLAMVETPKIPNNSVSNMFNIIPVGPDECTVKYSNKIKRDYKIRVTMKLPPPHLNSHVEIPVFVGERPIKKQNEGIDAKAGTSSEPMEPVEEPPSYWETVSCDEKICEK